MPRQKTFTIDSALDMATVLFARHGYRGTSVQAVAQHMKLSRSSIYITFRSKAELFAQVMRRATSRADGLGGLTCAVSPRAALVNLFVEAGADGRSGPPPLPQLLKTGVTHNEPEVSRLVDQTIRAVEARFRDAIERAQAADEIAADVDPAATAQVLLAFYLAMGVLTGFGTAAESIQSAALQQVNTLLPAPTEAT